MGHAFSCSRLALLTAVLASSPLVGAQRDVDAQYKQRIERLDEKDVAGHYKLAEWCRQQGRYDLVVHEAKSVLAVDPKHENASLLLKLAERKLRDERAKVPASRPFGAAPSALLADAQIQKLRWTELQFERSGIVEPVRVEFAKGFPERFLKDLADEADRDRFRRARSADRFQMVIDVSGGLDKARDEYADQIRILDDPRVFNEFKRAILPEVVKGCATAQCHGGATAVSFRLVSDRLQPTPTLYTNFCILQSAKSKDGRLVIDRDRPDKSLLLEYGLPAADVLAAHPAVQPPIKPLFRGTDDRAYRRFRGWIASLRIPQPDYGVQCGNVEVSGSTRPAGDGGGNAGATSRSIPGGKGK